MNTLLTLFLVIRKNNWVQIQKLSPNIGWKKIIAFYQVLVQYLMSNNQNQLIKQKLRLNNSLITLSYKSKKLNLVQGYKHYLSNWVRNWIADDHQNANKPNEIGTNRKSISWAYSLWDNLTQKYWIQLTSQSQSQLHFKELVINPIGNIPLQKLEQMLQRAARQQLGERFHQGIKEGPENKKNLMWIINYKQLKYFLIG